MNIKYSLGSLVRVVMKRKKRKSVLSNVEDRNGIRIDPPPTNNNSNKEKVLSIKSVEVALTVRSVKKFYNYTTKADGTKRKIVDIEDRNAAVENTDLILRDTITVSVNTRNIGLQ